jgi:hypothetical protein
VDAALAGNQDCDAGFNCVLLQNPCQVAAGSCGFAVSAVSVAGEAAVEHAFAVTAAEVCGACTPPTDDEDDGDGQAGLLCGSSTPGIQCTSGQCTVVIVLPDAGSCLPGSAGQGDCAADEFCDFAGVTIACDISTPYYITLIGRGVCTESSADSCQTNSDCNFDFDAGLTCVGASSGGFDNGVCEQLCPDPAVRPTACDGGCQLITDASGCNLCYCPNGCPGSDLPDGGPDGGADDGG